jgi:hypothetical protein
MKTYKQLTEGFKAQRIRPQKERNTSADHEDVKGYKVGDTVNCLQPDNCTHLPGKIKRFGQTMVHVTHNDGSEAAYRPEHIGMRVNSFNKNEDGKKKAFGESKEVVDKKTGQKYNPDDEIEKMYKSQDYVDMVKRMKNEVGKGWPKRKK